MSAADLPTSGDPLDEACQQCGLPHGEHNVRDWIAHTAMQPAYDVPFEAVPLGQIHAGPLGDITPADHVDVRVMAADAGIGVIGIVEMLWSQGNPTGPPRPVATVHFIGPPAVLRKAAKLLNQSFHRAANVAEGAR